MNGRLEFHPACYCAGTGCGGHLTITSDVVTLGYQGPAQHTATMGCYGFHPATEGCTAAPIELRWPT